MNYNHLQVYDLILKTKAPLFIGSGRKYTKKEFTYNPRTHKVAFIDPQLLMEKLIEKNLLDKYEHFILRCPNVYLYSFLVECGFSQYEIDEMTIFTADAADAVMKGKALSEVHEFIHDVKYRPYVPGSSLKGCLRTVLLYKMIHEKPIVFTGQDKADNVEAIYLNTLRLNPKQQDEVNSIMRGISISDSMPIDRENMILARKDDISKAGNRKPINLIRECVKPGVEIVFKLTLDKSVLKTIDVEFIREAVAEYGIYYTKTYSESFRMPQNAVYESFENCIVLGGGSGYYGKNIIYPLMGKEKAVRYVSKFMSKKFPRHKHENDIRQGISPHRLKHTTYDRLSYHFGVCEVKIV